jgi:hypothetical protein
LCEELFLVESGRNWIAVCVLIISSS